MLSVRCLSVLSVTLVYCGQTPGWMKTPLGMEVGLGPSQIVLGGDPAPPPLKGGTAPPNFKGWGWEIRNWTASAANSVALEQQRILVKTRSESV